MLGTVALSLSHAHDVLKLCALVSWTRIICVACQSSETLQATIILDETGLVSDEEAFKSRIIALESNTINSRSSCFFSLTRGADILFGPFYFFFAVVSDFKGGVEQHRRVLCVKQKR